MATRILTPDDIHDLPRPPGVRGFELIDGRLLTLRSMPPDHYRLRRHLIGLLAAHLAVRRDAGLVVGDGGFVLPLRRDRQRLRVADVACITRHDSDAHHEPERAFHCVPELVIEIAVGNAGKPGGAQRVIDFFEAGTRVIWAVDPYNREVLTYNRGSGAHNLRAAEWIGAAPVLPELRLKVAELFPFAHD